jgi:hypothetical protein
MLMSTRKQLVEEILFQGYMYVIHHHGVAFVPVRQIKPSVMRKLGLNRWKFDKLLLSEGQPTYHEDGFILCSCGARESSKLGYVTYNHEHPTFMNSFCYLQLNLEIARKIVENRKLEKEEKT